MMKEIENELIKKLEKIKETSSISTNMPEKDSKYEREVILDTENLEDTYKEHFTAKLGKENSMNSKISLFNETVGTFNYQYNSNIIKQPKSFTKRSLISKHLLDKDEMLESILPSQEDLNFSEAFNFRVFKILDSYSDISFAHSDLQLRQKMMKTYLFHILNHILKRKEEIEYDDHIEKLIEKSSHNNHKSILEEDLFINQEQNFLKGYETGIKNFAANKEDYFEEYKVKNKYKSTYEDGDYELIKDSGFTSPKVLILVPNKKHAKLIVEELINILRGGNWKGVLNKNKFKEEFSEVESMNDCFRLGLNFDFFENKLRLYQSFDTSDIIIASPLGLKLTTINDEAVKNKKVYDFLSSIEVLLIDFAEVFIYQNIDHLEEILSFLNKVPKNNQNIVNIKRIAEHVKDNDLINKRQSIIVSHFKSLELEVLTKKFFKNIPGGIYTIQENYHGCIKEREKENLVKYEFKILKALDEMDLFDYKFNYFTKNIWQSLYDTFDKHTIIFTSSALDFIRLKSFFKKNSVSVTFISEDTDKKDWQRNRLFFEEGRFKFLLFSERAHFYKKINLKFAKNIFFYSLPEDPTIFNEMIDLIAPQHYKDSLEKYKIEDKTLQAENYSAVIALVTKMERYNLEKILGWKTCSYIFKSKTDKYIC